MNQQAVNSPSLDSLNTLPTQMAPQAQAPVAQSYPVQGTAAMAPTPMYQPQSGYPNNVVQFPQPQTIPTAPQQLAPMPPQDYTPVTPVAMYQNPPIAYSQPIQYQPPASPNPGTQPSSDNQESGWKQAFHQLANLLATPVWGSGQNSQSLSSPQAQPLPQQTAQPTTGIPAGYQQINTATPTYYGNPAYGQGYSQQQQPQYLPQPGSADAPLSYMDADPNMPTDAELAAVGYSASMLNQYATEVEQHLLNLADRHQVLAQKYVASSEILTNPHVLANYVVDFNNHVDNTFLVRVADTFESVQAQGQPTQQHQPDPSVQVPMGQPGMGPSMVGSGMLTPEMLTGNDVIIPNGMNQYGPVMQAQPPQQMMMAAAQQGQGLQSINPGQRVAAPGLPVQGQMVTSDQVYSDLRQQFAMNPAHAWQRLSQIEQMYGPGAIAKPMVTI